MTPADRAAFANILAKLAHVYGREVDAPLLDAYWRALQDLTPEQLVTAADRALRESVGFPSPAVIRRLAGVDAASRLALLRQLMREFPLSYPPNMPADLKAAVRGLGGWRRLGNLTGDELDREFRASYTPEPPVEQPKEIAANVRSLTARIGAKE